MAENARKQYRCRHFPSDASIEKGRQKGKKIAQSFKTLRYPFQTIPFIEPEYPGSLLPEHSAEALHPVLGLPLSQE